TTGADRTQVTGVDRIELTGNDRTTAVEGTRRDRVARDALERIEGEQQVRVGQDRHVVTAAVRRELVEHDSDLDIERSRPESMGGTDSLTVGGSLSESVGSYVVNASGPHGTIHHVAGAAIVIDAASHVSIKAGGNFVDVGGGRVTIVGAE